MKNLRRDAVNFVEAAKPGTSAQRELTELMGRLTTGGRMNEETSDAESYSEWNQGELLCMSVESINKISEPCLINVMIDEVFVQMEVDCGSTVTVMGKIQFS